MISLRFCVSLHCAVPDFPAVDTVAWNGRSCSAAKAVTHSTGGNGPSQSEQPDPAITVVSQSSHISFTEMKGRELCQELPSPRSQRFQQAGVPAHLPPAGRSPQLQGLHKNKSEPCLDFISFAYPRTINLLFASKCIQRSQETETVL